MSLEKITVDSREEKAFLLALGFSLASQRYMVDGESFLKECLEISIDTKYKNAFSESNRAKRKKLEKERDLVKATANAKIERWKKCIKEIGEVFNTVSGDYYEELIAMHINECGDQMIELKK